MTKEEQEISTFYPPTQQAWRQWLEENHQSAQAVWLLFYKKKANIPTISWSEAVDEALCFGWIDSKSKPLDDDKFIQFFSRRKPKSTWSKINKEKINQLASEGRMTPAGWACIEIAKQNGSWTILDEVEELIVPADLDVALDDKPGAKDYFLSLSKSVKKSLLYWIVSAKRPETRQNRINDIVEKSAQQLKPGPF